MPVGGILEEGGRFLLLDLDFDTDFRELGLDFLGYLIGGGQVNTHNVAVREA